METICDTCGTKIVLGGVKQDGLRFCNRTCVSIYNSFDIADDELARIAESVHTGACPLCGGSGPVSVHRATWIVSFIFISTTGGQPTLSCRTCGNKSRVICAISSGFLGWWSFPIGLLGTPFVIGKNLLGLFKRPPGVDREMLAIVRTQLALAHAEEREHIPGQQDDELAATLIKPFPTAEIDPELPELVYQTDWVTVKVEVTRPQLECCRTITVTHDRQGYPLQLSPEMKNGQVVRIATGPNGPPIRAQIKVL